MDSTPQASPSATSLPSPSPHLITPTPDPTPTSISTPSRIATPSSIVAGNPSAWRLVFRDEFDGTRIDASKWQTEFWWGRKNPPEMQYYSPDAFEFQNGILRIKAEQRSMNGLAYTSGLISSKDHFQFMYGYAEIRARMPAGQGLWPAFWLTADAENVQTSSEIDVLEILGHDPQRVYMTIHYKDASGKTRTQQADFSGSDFSTDLHLFAVDWSPTAVVWYIDNVERFRVTQNIPHEPLYVIANLAVGGTWPGYPNNTTKFPAYLEIEYIRVYQSTP